MRLFSRFKVFVLAGVAALLIGVAGCGPGEVVWRIDGYQIPVSPLPKEAGK